MSSKRPAAKKKKKKPGFLGVTARLVMLVIAGLLALSYLSILVSPASLWFLSIFGLLLIPLALVALVVIAVVAGVVLGIVGTNGVIEAIGAGILVAAIGKILKKTVHF